MNSSSYWFFPQRRVQAFALLLRPWRSWTGAWTSWSRCKPTGASLTWRPTSSSGCLTKSCPCFRRAANLGIKLPTTLLRHTTVRALTVSTFNNALSGSHLADNFVNFPPPNQHKLSLSQTIAPEIEAHFLGAKRCGRSKKKIRS